MDGIDRISSLPCHLINEILKFLPLGDVVRTSILSKGWHHKWRSIPYLVFDESSENILVGKPTIDSVIYQGLLLHRGCIFKITLDSDYDNDVDNSFWAVEDQWLNILSVHRIQELTHRFSFASLSEVMYQHLFSFDHLRQLYLVNCSLKPPISFKGFATLVTLVLKNVGLIEHSKFISRCQMLEHLKLYYDIWSIADLEIDAPNLKSFVFRGKCASIYFKKTPLLEKVSIDYVEDPVLEKSQGSAVNYGKSQEGSAVNLIEYFGQLSSVKKLDFNWRFLQFLSAGDVPQNLPTNLSHLSDFRCCVDFASMAEVSCAFFLIRSSPNLRSIEIDSITTLDKDMKFCTEFLKEQYKLKFTLKHLVNVNIDGFSGSKPEMEFVKLILSKATALRKLELKLLSPLHNASKQGGYVLFKELAGFPRASSQARIFT